VGQTLVVSAIAGLGGLGKSVLATAIVLDAEVLDRCFWKFSGSVSQIYGGISQLSKQFSAIMRIRMFFFTLDLSVDRSSIIYYIYMLQNNFSRFFIATSVAISAVAMASQSSFAGTRNVDFSNITRSELVSYCNGKMDRTYGEVKLITWSERLFSCVGEVRETYNSRVELNDAVNGGLSAEAKIRGVGLGAGMTRSIRVSASGSATLTVRFQRRQFKLTDYCRDLKSYGLGHVFDPRNGNGRIFVANGGRTCQQTVVD
jgi:hypothetical protein